MKLKLLNYVSAACFFLSSVSLLFIPLLNLEDGFSGFAYFFAGLFWLGLLVGMTLQMYLLFKTNKRKVGKPFKKLKLIIGSFFVLAVVTGAFVFICLKTNSVALSVSLFVVFLSTEVFFVIKRMEKLL